VLDLAIDEFHTYRFESLDGINYFMSVDGTIFLVDQENQPNGYSAISFAGRAGCLDDQIPNAVNEWDFVRFGTIGYGERIVASDPPGGFVDARVHPSLDRFTITYDSPNYVYINDVTVTVTSLGTDAKRHEATEEHPNPERERRAPTPLNPPLVKGEAGPAPALGVRTVAPLPVVIATRRLDNGPTDVVEIVLDRPIPYGATTRFTFNDGALAQSLQYTFAPGDTNGDGRADLADFAYFQNCFGLGTVLSNPAPCAALDFNADSDIDLSDFAAFERVFAAP
ncbi:MAG: dockerin type I repeat-containing protein, partial [Planctomycetota bacterium]